MFFVKQKPIASLLFLPNRIKIIRGAITKKKRENLGKIPKGGGWVEKTDENSQFQFGNFENPGGVSIFQKCLNYKSGSDPILKRRIEN